MNIKKDMVVCFRYVMRNEWKEILENTMSGTPVSYLHGSKDILPYLQLQMEGLAAGDRKIIFLSRESGLTDADYTFEVMIDQVRSALPEELILGYPVLLASERCEADCECYKETGSTAN